MTLPASGPISLGQVNTALSRGATNTINMNEANVRTLAGVPSGAISMSSLHGKSWWITHTGNLFQMTSANAPAPRVVTAPNGWYLEHAWRLFDNIVESNGDWLTGGTLSLAQIDLVTPVRPIRMTLIVTRVFNPSLRSIFIEGSNNLSTWDILWQNLNSGATINVNTLLTDNGISYRYLRFRMTSAANDYQDRPQAFSITEWRTRP